MVSNNKWIKVVFVSYVEVLKCDVGACCILMDVWLL